MGRDLYSLVKSKGSHIIAYEVYGADRKFRLVRLESLKYGKLGNLCGRSPSLSIKPWDYEPCTSGYLFTCNELSVQI